MFVVHSLAYGLRPIKDYLTLETNPNFLISVYPQTITITITKQWNTHGRKPHPLCEISQSYRTIQLSVCGSQSESLLLTCSLLSVTQ
ncbi:hypothetical protein EB796_000678 [Bugula neritina]|uniref:Uncharacterized protein n=1 Tax=Bugula neritina TaxID=10212 RepID=A0A7J7KRZ4_BUGNE|nr:hypothetical protein EB796_000678 [Bugula neritina]